MIEGSGEQLDGKAAAHATVTPSVQLIQLTLQLWQRSSCRHTRPPQVGLRQGIFGIARKEVATGGGVAVVGDAGIENVSDVGLSADERGEARRVLGNA